MERLLGGLLVCAIGRLVLDLLCSWFSLDSGGFFHVNAFTLSAHEFALSDVSHLGPVRLGRTPGCATENRQRLDVGFSTGLLSGEPAACLTVVARLFDDVRCSAGFEFMLIADFDPEFVAKPGSHVLWRTMRLES